MTGTRAIKAYERNGRQFPSTGARRQAVHRAAEAMVVPVAALPSVTPHLGLHRLQFVHRVTGREKVKVIASFMILSVLPQGAEQAPRLPELTRR
jgi:hypothetical protein